MCCQTLRTLQHTLGILIFETLQCGKEELKILIMFSIFNSKIIESES